MWLSLICIGIRITGGTDCSLVAAGDMRRGQSLIVWAILEGRDSTHHVDQWLMVETNLPCLLAHGNDQRPFMIGMELMYGCELIVQVVDGGSVCLQPLSDP